MTAPAIGETIPEFTALATSGKAISLAELRGKHCVIYFYPKDSTPGCTQEGQDFRDLYPEFARIADEEGFKEVAAAFKMISKVEKAHEERYRTLFDNLESGKVFKRGDKVVWKCRNCGYLHEAASAPQTCPACLHPQSYFEIQEKNY